MPDRFVCPDAHKHSEHCYKKHGCRCDDCRADNTERAAARWRRAHPNAPERAKRHGAICACGCGQMTRNRWVNGHNATAMLIKPAGMTWQRALEIAMGAQPHHIDRSNG